MALEAGRFPNPALMPDGAGGCIAKGYNRTRSNPLPQFEFSLKLHLEAGVGLNVFSGYGDGYVSVNGERHVASLIVMPREIVPGWAPARFEDLAADHFVTLAGCELEIVLLGTGARLRFPRPEVIRPLVEARMGIEVMDVQAACRTYNILMGEGRKVAAALVLG